MEHYSILMSVYYKEKPEYLSESIQSMLHQTVPPDDYVLVCDGPLTPGLDQVIDHFVHQEKGLFQVIRLEKNQGLGNALNAGMKYCKNDLVARMDSDDISLPERCELQLKKFEESPELDIVSGTVLDLFRADANMYGRRGGFGYLKKMCKFRTYMYKSHFCSFRHYLMAIVGQSIVCLVPTGLRRILYNKLLRN